MIALGTHANKQGRVADTNIAGGEAGFDGALGTAITKFQQLEIARTGLTEREAAARLDAFAVTTKATGRAGCYPVVQSMHIKIVAARSTGWLLGAQTGGGEDAGKRIDVLARAAKWHDRAGSGRDGPVLRATVLARVGSRAAGCGQGRIEALIQSV